MLYTIKLKKYNLLFVYDLLKYLMQYNFSHRYQNFIIYTKCNKIICIVLLDNHFSLKLCSSH